ncbi:unnamed protein product [Leptosia nina]|uniref:Ig-like domain-containing protein n=1 Tax=Leptosia nina TaxID=320188 RepID=A0AAV1JN07_9NEOP
MARTAVCCALAFLFLANSVSSEIQTDAPAPGNIAPALVDEGSSPLEDVLYDVRSNITLRCGVDAGAGGSIVWRKNGTVLEEVWEMKDRYSLERGKLEMHVARALEDDFGNYSCALPSQPPANRWQVRARPHLKLPANTNVVEGQKLKLTCKVVGKPYPRVNWGYTNSSEENANFTALNAEEGRITLSTSEQGVPDGTLVVEAAERTDAGRYRCSVEGSTVGETLLRVKDKYAALWPFLGICAEVFVLCAIILVYEKRRTKPDLDDSDTDNHDQKKS